MKKIFRKFLMGLIVVSMLISSIGVAFAWSSPYAGEFGTKFESSNVVDSVKIVITAVDENNVEGGGIISKLCQCGDLDLDHTACRYFSCSLGSWHFKAEALPGYEFVGWDTSDNSGNQGAHIFKGLIHKDEARAYEISGNYLTINHVRCNIDLLCTSHTYFPKALFKKIQYDITFNAGEGGSFADGKTSVIVKTKHNDIPAQPTPPAKSGYDFKGWSPTLVAATKAATYEAQYSQKPPVEPTIYQITFNAGNGAFEDGTKTKVQSVKQGAMPTAPKVIAPTGYSFSGWSPTLAEATKAAVYEAQYTQIPPEEPTMYQITFNAGIGAFEDGTKTKVQSVKQGTIPTAPTVIAPTGYSFSSWSPTLAAATKAATYEAQYSQKPPEEPTIYQISFNAGNGAFEDGTKTKVQSVKQGAMPTAPTVIAPTGYSFSSWSPTLAEATKVAVYEAQYTKKDDPTPAPTPSPSGPTTYYYTLAVKVVGQGTVDISPIQGSYAEGTVVTLTPKAAEGWVFDSFDSGSNQVTINTNRTVTATFKKAPVIAVPEEEIPLTDGTDEDNTQDVNKEEEIILDEKIPQTSGKLPKTGGMPIEIFTLGGAFISAFGVMLRRKDEDEL